jgi:hypothetical protein
MYLKGIERSNLRKWIGFYKYYGAIGLLPRKNQSYSISWLIMINFGLEGLQLKPKADQEPWIINVKAQIG